VPARAGRLRCEQAADGPALPRSAARLAPGGLGRTGPQVVTVPASHLSPLICSAILDVCHRCSKQPIAIVSLRLLSKNGSSTSSLEHGAGCGTGLSLARAITSVKPAPRSPSLPFPLNSPASSSNQGWPGCAPGTPNHSSRHFGADHGFSTRYDARHTASRSSGKAGRGSWRYGSVSRRRLVAPGLSARIARSACAARSGNR
jgi:hypothetical protein